MEGRFNASALPPQTPNQGPLTRGPSICQPPHATWHPSRASVWTRVASCHVSAPPAPPMRHLRLVWAMRGPATWPQCHIASALVPRHGSSARHMSSADSAENKPLFARFKSKKINISSIKNQIKVRKIS